METSSPIYERIISQIEEAYGKLIYTYTCHLKQARIYNLLNNCFSWADIVLTAVTAGSLLGLLFTDEKTLAIISAICAALSLMSTLFQKEADLGEKAVEHKAFALKLWLPREKYISLLTDAPTIDLYEIQNKRDELINTVNDLYSVEPMTSNFAYRMSQKALKEKGEQFFTRDEINHILPQNIRH